MMAKAPARPRLVPELPEFEVAEEPVAPSGPTPTTTDADRLAAQVTEALQSGAALIERLRYPHPKLRRSARGARTVSKDFVRFMAALVDNSASLQRLNIFSSPRAREGLQFMEAFLPVLNESETFTNALRYTLEAVHADLVEEALGTYRLANVLARTGRDPELAARLETLKKVLGRKSGRAAAKRKKKDAGDDDAD
jgi:hypothetical protein